MNPRKLSFVRWSIVSIKVGQVVEAIRLLHVNRDESRARDTFLSPGNLIDNRKIQSLPLYIFNDRTSVARKNFLLNC